jgi:hypothetical protein
MGYGLNIIRNAQKIINKKDQLLLLQKVSKHQFVHKIAECVGWKKLWDHALDHGPSVIKGMKNLVRVITYPDRSPSKCPLCDTPVLDKPILAKHVITNHTKNDNSWCTLRLPWTPPFPVMFYASCMFFNYCIPPSLCYTSHAWVGPFNMNFELYRVGNSGRGGNT